MPLYGVKRAVGHNNGMTPEGLIKKNICDYLAHRKDVFYTLTPTVGVFDQKRGIFRKNNSKHQLNGMADITGFILLSRLPIAFFLEVKTKTNRQSDDQIEFERLVKARGGFYYVVRSIDDAELALQDIVSSIYKEKGPGRT